MIVHFDIGWKDTRTYKRAYDSFVAEASYGRTQSQIHFDGAMCVLSTPESGSSLLQRLISKTKLREDFDQIVIIEVQYRRLHAWGRSTASLIKKFPLFEVLSGSS